MFWKIKRNIIRDTRNLLRLRKETAAIKDRILRYNKNLFEYKDYYKLVIVSNVWINNCIEYKSKGDSKTL